MMSNTITSSAIAIPSIPPRPPPSTELGVIAWLRLNLFKDRFSAILTLLLATGAFVFVPNIIRWALVNAVWTTNDPNECRVAMGACWAVISEKYRVILFGTFPYHEQWRAVLAMIIVIGISVISAFRRFWSYQLFLVWVFAALFVLVLMLGGVFGLSLINTNQWGGLPLTLLMFVGTVVGGLPLAIILALGRRSSLLLIKAISIGLVEIIRGVPLITILFVASLMLPLFLPESLTIDKFVRAEVGMILFFAAYAAEVVRGGLQAISHGQYEAADSIGLSYWRKMTGVILPQALRIVIPSLMNDIIRAFKNTTFVSILGLFDILGATSTALEDPLWVTYAPEAYLFVFSLYFVFCFSMSQYSKRLEKDLRTGQRL